MSLASFTSPDEPPGPGSVVRIEADGTITPVLEGIPFPHGITFDDAGNPPADDVLRLYAGDRLDALRYLANEERAISDNHPYVEFHRTLRAERRPPDVSSFRRDPRQLVGENAACLP